MARSFTLVVTMLCLFVQPYCCNASSTPTTSPSPAVNNTKSAEECQAVDDPEKCAVSIVISGVKSIALTLLAPFVIVFGKDLNNIVILVQALMLADIESLLHEFKDFCPLKIPVILKHFVRTIVGTAGIAFGMMKDKNFQAASSGLALGAIVTNPLIGSMTSAVLGDQPVCAATPEFPGGAPCAEGSDGRALQAEPSKTSSNLCDMNISFDAPEVMMSWWFVGGFPTLIALVLGRCAIAPAIPDVPALDAVVPEIGGIQPPKLTCRAQLASITMELSYAFTGTFMLLDGLDSLILPTWSCLDPCGAKEVAATYAVFSLAFTYGIGGASFLFQRYRALKKNSPPGLVSKLNAKLGRLAGVKENDFADISKPTQSPADTPGFLQ